MTLRQSWKLHHQLQPLLTNSIWPGDLSHHPVSLSQKLKYFLKLVSGPTLQSRVVFHKAARKLRATLRMTGEPFTRAQSSPVNVSFVSFTTRKDHQLFLTYEQLYETAPRCCIRTCMFIRGRPMRRHTFS